MSSSTSLERYLEGGSRYSRTAREFLSHSAHFPIMLILLELLLHDPLVYLAKPDLYVLLMAALLQSYWIGTATDRPETLPIWSYLIAPALYTVTEVALELEEHKPFWVALNEFISAPHHAAFWSFALVIGLLHALRELWQRQPFLSGLLTILESLLRTLMLGVMYFIFEDLSNGDKPLDLSQFFGDGSHLFFILSLLFVGLLLGGAHLSADRYLKRLRETSQQLHTYSSWLLGKQLLESAVSDPARLTLQRRERTVLFMDIRGFTAWCEAQPPEQVVAMLNGYFEAAEQCWVESTIFAQVIKVKHTGDEIMVVFGTPEAAQVASLELRRRITPFLRRYRLGAGIGIHCGALVEGLLGSREVRSYDIIGDTVNTAKRICDHAAAGELLLSASLYRQLTDPPPIRSTREVMVKGKSEPLELVVI